MIGSSFYSATIGAEVRYHSYAWGWRFGVVRAVRTDENGLQHATVAWHKQVRGWPDVCELPSFRMEPCIAG